MDFDRRILPYYMTYPGPYGTRREDTVIRDLEYLQQLYPLEVRRYQRRVAQLLDRMAITGDLLAYLLIAIEVSLIAHTGDAGLQIHIGDAQVEPVEGTAFFVGNRHVAANCTGHIGFKGCCNLAGTLPVIRPILSVV